MAELPFSQSSKNICDKSTNFYALKNRIQAAWTVKCKAVIKQNFIDDIELDEEGVAEMLLDENAVASMPRYLVTNFSV
jgi:hypothetical protein